ncbi:major capsid protein [Grimontia hollisae]|uniref:major capsid protein n=1 Tax=Grimontia hollisae TaxID=673 RepID=UPI0023DBAD69|nr:major capsid protein [Grimontia hollisae]MDF2186303.1 major capsid protein [Grimontia hollisae]
MRKMKTAMKYGVVLAATVAAPAFAEGGIDVSGAVTVIGTITAAVTAVGAAKLAPAATSVAFKWVKGAIFS